MKKNWICGIDLGSSQITGVVGRVEAGQLSLFGAASVESRGIAKGVVTDLGETASAVRELVDRLEFQTKLRLEGALLAQNGSHLECVNVPTEELVLERGKEVTPREVRRLLKQAQSLPFPINRQFLHVLLQGYVVDGQEGIHNPVGMYAHRLGVQLKGVTGVSTFIQNAITTLHRAGLEVEGVVLSGYATALAALGKEEKNFDSLFLEIGEGMSSLILFHEGGVARVKLFSVGGDHLTDLIAKKFEISLKQAETLKREYGTLFLSESEGSHELLVSEESRKKIILKRELHEVIKQGVEQLFQTFQKETKAIPHFSGLILGGGGALLEGVAEAAGAFFHCSSRLGSIENVHSTKPLPLSLATAVGLIWYGQEKQKEEESLSESPTRKVLTKVKELFLNYF